MTSASCCTGSLHSLLLPHKSKPYPRQRWYQMKEDFSPELVTEAMSKSSRQGDLILDPFSGSGTVALFGRMAKRQTVAIEVNPFLAFVAGVKHARVGPSEVGRSIRTVIGGIECGSPSPLVGFSTFTTSRTGGPGLFNEDVLTAFEGG
jgi:hypothetical protein